MSAVVGTGRQPQTSAYRRKNDGSGRRRSLVVDINAFNFEYDRSGAVIAAGDHHLFVIRPAIHDLTALQRGIDVTTDAVPGFRTEGFFGSPCGFVGIVRRLGEGVETQLPVIVTPVVTAEQKFIPGVETGTRTGLGIGQVFFLQIRKDFGFQNGDFALVFHG